MSEEKTRVFNLSDGRRLEVPIEDLEYIFKGMRPRLMSSEDFRVVSKILKKEVKEYLKGRIEHVSKVTDSVWNEYTKEQGKRIKQRGHTYVKEK